MSQSNETTNNTDTSVIINGKNGFTDHNGNFTEVTKDQWGFINKQGKVVIPPIYHEVYDFSDGFAMVKLAEEDTTTFIGTTIFHYKTIFIDKTGKEVPHLKRYKVDRYNKGFVDGFLKVELGYKEKKALVNTDGKIITLKEYDDFGNFSEGLASVYYGSQYGYIDTTGTEVIPCKFSKVSEFSEGLAQVRIGKNKVGFINKTGEVVIDLSGYTFCKFSKGFSGGLAEVKRNDKYGFIDTTGTEVVPVKYDKVDDFSEGLAGVKLNDKWGFIDTTGQEIIALKYDEVGYFSEGLASVQLNNKFGFVNTTGQEVIPLIYEDDGLYCYYNGFSDGLVQVHLNNKYGFINKEGQVVIPIIYDKARLFKEGLIEVRLNGKYGFFDKTGTAIIPLQYDETAYFKQGLMRVRLDDKWGFVDTTGKEVIPPQFDKLGEFHEGMAKVLLNGKNGFANILRYIRDFELPTMTATETELQEYKQEKQQFLRSENWQEVLSNKSYQPHIKMAETSYVSPTPVGSLDFGVKFEEYYKWVALQDLISASDVDNFNLLNILKPLTSFSFFLGSDCETLIQKFVNSDYAQTVETLRVGNSSFVLGDGFEYEKLTNILSTGHYPQLKQFELGCWQLYSNSHVGFGYIGCIDKVLATMPNLERLGLFGDFMAKKPLELPYLQHLEIRVKDEVSFRQKQISQETLDNLLNSSLPQLKTLRIDLGRFSYDEEDFIRYTLPKAFCSGQSCPQLQELYIRGDLAKNGQFIIDCCNGKIFSHLKRITYAKSLCNLGIKKLKKTEFVKANDVRVGRW